MNQIPRRQALRTLGLGAAALAAAGPLFAAPQPSKTTTTTAEPKDSEVGFKDGKFVLPPLPYGYADLEPAIDEATMKLHHDTHHAAYVKGGNAALEALAAIAAGTGDSTLTGHWNNELAFHGSGHALHTMFWNNMKRGGSKPSGALADALKAGFGSQEAFEKLFSATAAAVQGSGWAILGYDAVSKKLQVIQAEKHQNQTLQSITPILVLDVWEHAYYLKYQSKRAEYVKAFLTIINYDDVASLLAKAVAAA